MSALKPLLTQALIENQLDLPDSAIQQILSYLALLAAWNRVFNLTTITKSHDMVYLHIIDSLMMRPYLYGTHCLDVGSGAGLPGIPLAIVNPQQNWVLLDKNSKKTRFLTQAVAELKLTNVEVVHSNMMDFHPDTCFDTILARALGTIRMFIAETAHLLCPAGILLAMKGKYPEEELDELPKNYVAQTTRVKIRGFDVERHVISLKRKS